MTQSLHYIIKHNNVIGNFKMVQCVGSDIVLSAISKKLSKQNSVLVCLPLRIGYKTVAKEYFSQITRILTFRQCVGIAGGHAHQSVYFCGVINPHLASDPYLLYLDPHYV